VQLALAHHVKSRMIAKMTIQHQVGQMDRASEGVQEALQQLLDALQLWVECHLRLVFVATACLAFLACFLALLATFFFFRANHLFHTDRVRASLLGANQGQHENGQPRNRFLLQTGEK
jgi:hypothetical protein